MCISCEHTARTSEKDAKKEPKKEEKKGGNPFTGPLLFLGGLYGLGLYADREEKKAAQAGQSEAPKPKDGDSV